jgi:hypothetical protein
MKHLVLLLLCSAPILAQLPSDIGVLHRTVPLDGANLHAIVTKPKTPGRYAAVFVISGLGCYPLDPPEKDTPFNQLRYGFDPKRLCDHVGREKRTRLQPRPRL